jgi:hypothetical protein
MNSPMPAKSTICWQPRFQFAAAQAQQRAVEAHVLAPGQVRAEACAQLQQCRNPTLHATHTGAGLQHTCHDLQQRALAGAVAAHHTQHLATPQLQVHIVQGVVAAPGLRGAAVPSVAQLFPQARPGSVLQRVALGNTDQLDHAAVSLRGGIHGPCLRRLAR